MYEETIQAINQNQLCKEEWDKIQTKCLTDVVESYYSGNWYTNYFDLVEIKLKISLI